MKGFLTIAVLAVGISGMAKAAIIVNNGLPNQTGGSDMNFFLEADNFTLGTTAIFDTIRFWSLQSSVADYDGSIEWSIRNDSAGAPGAIAFSGLATPAGVATGNMTLGLNEFMYQFSVNFTLNPGAYWLVLHNGPSSVQPGTNFYWAFTNDQAGNSQSFELPLAGGGPWLSNSAELAFQLEGSAADVPEPSSVILVSSGLALAAVVRRRLKSAHERSSV